MSIRRVVTKQTNTQAGTEQTGDWGVGLQEGVLSRFIENKTENEEVDKVKTREIKTENEEVDRVQKRD